MNYIPDPRTPYFPRPVADKPAGRTCGCCNRHITAAQDTQETQLREALNRADEELSAANRALSEASRNYAQARKTRAAALSAKVKHSEAVHGPLKW